MLNDEYNMVASVIHRVLIDIMGEDCDCLVEEGARRVMNALANRLDGQRGFDKVSFLGRMPEERP